MRSLMKWLIGGSLASLLVWVMLGLCVGSGTYTVYYGEGLEQISKLNLLRVR